jgi:hypothetical protein
LVLYGLVKSGILSLMAAVNNNILGIDEDRSAAYRATGIDGEEPLDSEYAP